MKQNKLSIRWKIFAYLCVFVGIFLFLLYLFQVVFLDDFYRMVKTNQINDTVNELSTQIEKKGLNDVLEEVDEITHNSDYCIRIADHSTGTIYGNDNNQNICGFIGGSETEVITQVATLYKDATENNGEVFKIENTANRIPPTLPHENKEDKFFSRYDNIMSFDYLIQGKITYHEDDEYFVLVNSRITLVSEITETINKQLMLISGMILLLALVVAFYIANMISTPIISINESAKRLAEGKFDEPFIGTGYKEIEELNETLNYAEKELQKTETLRNELIANISHDLRTPLTMIGGYGEIMRDIPGENTPENVQVIIDECKRLTILVNDILDLSRLQANAQKLNIREFNITQGIKAIINRFSKMLQSEEYHIQFEYDQECIVLADEVKINQVVYNLLANAINYCGEDKKITVRQMNEQDYVRIEVSDHGEGIEEENLPYVWERYYKLDKVHKRPQIGTGLGLSIVKNVLDLHQGEYGVNSKVQEGTTFYFKLKKKEMI